MTNGPWSGNCAVYQRVGLIAEGPQGEEEVLVTAVAGHDLIRLQAKVHRRRFQQVGAPVPLSNRSSI